MILIGKNITSPQDPLVKVPVVNVWHALKNPHSETLALIRQLRIIRSIDAKRYSVLKRQLPYLVCGIFSPPFRRSENFAYIEYFILDIDHISDKELLVSELKSRIVRDNRVVLCFTSPSEDGLKILFRLSERCYDKGIFSLFYKAFAQQFARQYNIEQVIDTQTCDVTRACFVSCDPDAYYNPEAQPVSLGAFIPDSPADMFDLKRELEQPKKTENDEQMERKEEKTVKADVDAEVMRNIKAILNPNVVQKTEKQIFVPEQLNDVIEELRKYIEQTGVVVTEIVNINYGKKIRLRMSYRQAEVNLFYGKRGFSVVKSPRAGTDAELNELMTQLIQTFIYTNT